MLDKKNIFLFKKRIFSKYRERIFSWIREKTNKTPPSEPNTPWANRTGKATAGVYWKQNLSKGQVWLENSVYYVSFLENGTKKMIKRPTMYLAIKSNVPIMKREIAQEFKKSLSFDLIKIEVKL